MNLLSLWRSFLWVIAILTIGIIIMFIFFTLSDFSFFFTSFWFDVIFTKSYLVIHALINLAMILGLIFAHPTTQVKKLLIASLWVLNAFWIIGSIVCVIISGTAC